MKKKRARLCGAYYKVYENGTIVGCVSGMRIKQRLNADGYLVFTAGKKGRRNTYFTHRIVALAFLPNPNNLSDVDHLDSNRANPDVNNLEWVSHKENVRRSHKRGNHNRKGEKNGRAKLTKERVLKIRKLYAEGVNRNELARMFSCGWTTVDHIIKRETWTDF